MPVCRVAPDLGVRRGGDSRISEPQACGRQDCYCTQTRQSLHVTYDTKVTAGARVTIDAQVNYDTTTGIHWLMRRTGAAIGWAVPWLP